MNKDEREKLTELIEENDGENWWKQTEFEKYIYPRLPNELIVIAPPPEYIKNYNCFVFALGLEHDPEFLGGNNPVQQEFIEYLLDKHVFNVIENPKSNDLVFYKDSVKNITHAGILKTTDRMLSKWMWGPIIENNLLDVPASFGDTIFYTKPLKPGKAKEQYLEYKASGVEIKPIS